MDRSRGNARGCARTARDCHTSRPRVCFEQKLIGGAAIRQTGSPLPAATLAACLAGDAVLLGAVGSPEFDSLTPPNRPEAGLLLLRRGLGGMRICARDLIR